MGAPRRALILPVVLGLVGASLPALAQQPRAERPTYSPGQRWLRSDGAYELIRVERDLYIFASDLGREIHLTKDLALAKLQKGNVVFEFDPPPRLAWPLVVGKWDTSSGRVRTPRSPPGGFPANFTWKVEAYEDVTVTGGTFKAFRVALWIENPRTGRRVEVQTWYAPEVRQFVKAESQEMTGLAFQVVAVDRPVAVPLRVILDDPKDQARVTGESIVVVGKVKAAAGVARVTVFLNGQEVPWESGRGASQSEVALNLPIKLREGKNVLLVTAADSGGNVDQEARTVVYEKPVAVAPPPTVTAPAAPPEVKPRPVPLEPAPPTGPPAVAALPPFQLTLSSPPDQARVHQESVGLAGVVSGGKGISRVLVALNGAEVSRLEERTAQRAMALNVPLKLRDGPNTLVVTATEADGTIHQEVRTVHYEKVVPLTVAFRYPEDRGRVSEEASVVAAVVTSSKGVARVSVTLNGVEVHQQSERVPQRSVLVTVPVTLREGANAIAVTATEADGTVRQEVRTVVYDKPKTVVSVPVAPPPPPVRDRWAVVIGVGKYESPEIPALRYSVRDAEAIYQSLTGPAGFKKEHVLLLTDKTEKKPTLRNVKWALGTFLARSARRDDTVLIFFAGHGAPEVDQRGVERDGLAKYLIPSDADPEDLFSTALPMDDIQTIFGRIEAERVVVFLDACYSGAAGGRTFASKKTRAGHVDDLFLERLTRAKGRAIVTASRPAEVSIELPELGHGIFTYYLVRGLQGAGDLNRDGIVSLQELYEYVEQQVTQKSRAVGGNQHPVMKGELEGVLPLVKVGAR